MRRRKRWLSAVLCCLLFVSAIGLRAGPTGAETADEAFEALLTAQKFPESYKPALRALHKQYPSWVFTAQQIDLDWNEVLTAECRVGVNMVPASSLNSWKSCDKGAYDPEKGTWYGLDGNSWVGASREIIAYYLDPRNALTDPSIFQFEKLSRSSHHTAAGVEAILKGSFMTGSYTCPDTKQTFTYADTFLKAAEVSGVSAYHLASRARQEQGSNGNALGHGNVPGYAGYFNFFNVGAYTTSTASALQNGAKYAAGQNAAYYLPWTNPYKSILGGGVILGSSYINRGQDTLYLQKFDVVDGGNGFFSHQYMGNVLAPTSEAAIMKRAYTDEVLHSPIEFCIPIYRNMPETACPKPSSAGDNNNWLKSLTVGGQSLTPTFSMYTTAYELVVDSGVSSVTISATASGKGASVSGTGVIPLKGGNNTVTIRITAASGVTRDYILRIYRTPSAGDDGPVPELKSSAYRIGETIAGVQPGTTAEAFLKNLSAEGGDLAVVTRDGKPRTGPVATDDRVQVIQDGALRLTLPIVIRGDVNGDGRINVVDLLSAQKHLLGVSALSGCPLLAADINGDGSVNVLDLMKGQRYLFGIDSITQ